MERAQVDDSLLTPAEFVAWRSQQRANGRTPPPTGHSWAHCPDCAAPVTPRAVGQLPVGRSPAQASQPAPHFAHLPETADPECAYLSPPDPHFFAATPATLLPPPGHSSWRRRMPGWARPYVWLQYHAFRLQGRWRDYAVRFAISVSAKSYLHSDGSWQGEPAKLLKQFADSGRALTTREGAAWQASITRAAARAAARAALGRSPRPYPDVPVHKLEELWLFGETPRV